MFDAGLLATGLAVWLVVAVTARWAPVEGIAGSDVAGLLTLPVLGGILASRAVTVVVDDPASLQSFRAFLVVRGGVEFWPGAIVAAGLIVCGAWRRAEPGVRLLADLAPFLLWGYAAFEAGCLLRDGCYGPASPIGLTPPGLSTSMFPVGLLVAAAMVGLGIGLRHINDEPPVVRVLVGIAGLAAARSVASIWLPRLSDGPTRQHIESLAVLAVSAAMFVAVTRRRRADVNTAVVASAGVVDGGDEAGS